MCGDKTGMGGPLLCNNFTDDMNQAKIGIIFMVLLFPVSPNRSWETQGNWTTKTCPQPRSNTQLNNLAAFCCKNKESLGICFRYCTEENYINSLVLPTFLRVHAFSKNTKNSLAHYSQRPSHTQTITRFPHLKLSVPSFMDNNNGPETWIHNIF